MTIKCAIFDFDGTLFDSMFLWEHVGKLYLHSQGREPKASMQEDIRALSLYQSSCYFQREYELSVSVEEIMEEICGIIEHFYLYEVLPKPGVVDFLKKMQRKGISMCIATASERGLIEAALKRCKMETYFEKIFTCTEVGHGKDSPIIFRKAMEYFGTDRKHTVVFEDAMHAVWTARKDGFTTVAVLDKSEERQEEIRKLADYYIADFEHTENFWREFVWKVYGGKKHEL